MELYFAASGVKHELDYFENQMQFMPFMLPFTDKDGNKMVQPLYGNLAPIKLYKFVFPKEYLDEVLATLDLPNKGKYLSQFDLQAAGLRKIMKAKKIPTPKKGTKPRLFHRGNIAIKGIGIKEDVDNWTDPAGNTHEAI